jgi:hypothetical protein
VTTANTAPRIAVIGHMLPFVPIRTGIATEPIAPQIATRQSESFCRVFLRSASVSTVENPMPQSSPRSAIIPKTRSPASPGSMLGGSTILITISTTPITTIHPTAQAKPMNSAPRTHRIARFT